MFDDSPRSVASTSLRLVPKDSRLESPDALRNGKPASETAGPEAAGADVPVTADVDRWLMTYAAPPTTISRPSAATAGTRYFRPARGGVITAVGGGAIACPSLARSRSCSKSALVWYLATGSGCR